MAANRSANDPVPFFAGGDATPPRRILLVSYHFPPGQAIGAVRWQRLTQHGAARGWGVDAITLDPADVDRLDPARLNELPASTRVFGVRLDPSPLTSRLSAVVRFLRALRPGWARKRSAGAERSAPRAAAGTLNSLARDEVRALPMWGGGQWRRAVHAALLVWAARRWGRNAARVALSILDPRLHRVVVGCGPPHWEAMLAARRVARRAGVPYVMDLRDPWSMSQRLPEWHASRLWYALAARDEALCVRDAALVVANTEPAAAAMRARHPDHAAKIITVMNGSDPDTFPTPARGRRFVVLYTGTVYLDRDPRPVFRAASRVVRELGLGPSDFGFEFVGLAESFGGETVADMARKEGLGDYVATHPERPRRELSPFLARAAMMLVLPQDSELAIPGKVFECVQMDAWLLALCRPGSAVAEVLRDTSADVVAPHDIDGIAGVLRRRYTEFSAGVQPVRVDTEGRFQRSRQAQVLFEAIERIVDAPARL